MAKPQIENGYTKIANEILEHLMRMSLSPNQWQVLLCIIRKTYGFQKKVDYIANFQIAKDTGLCKSVVSRCLQKLNHGNLISRKGKYIGLQKDWEKWKLAEQSTIDSKLAEQSTIDSKLAEQLTPLDNKSKQNSQPKLAIQSTKVSSPHVTQKKKETIQKKEYGEFSNVLLTDDEYEKLTTKFKNSLNDKIEELSSAIASKGYKYKSHYATLLNWSRRKQVEAVGNHHKPREEWL